MARATVLHVLFLERCFDRGRFGHVVAAPDRHCLLALPLADASALAGLRGDGPDRARFTEAPGAITDQLYWRRTDGGLVGTPCGIKDEGGPWVAPPDELNQLFDRLPVG